MTRNSLPTRSAWLATLATLVTAALALFALAGWAFDVAALRGVSRHWQPMSATTATCLLLVAVQLACLQRCPSAVHRRLAMRMPSIFVGLVGLLAITLYSIELITGSDPPVENVPLLRLFWFPTARPAALTAILLTLVGGALWLLATGRRRAADVAHALALPVAMAGYLVILSYVLGVSAMHEHLGVRVALNTGLAFCAVSVAMLALRPDTWLTSVFAGDQPGNAMARRLLPVLLIVPAVIGWLRLYGERSGTFHSEDGVALVALTYAVVLLGLVWLTARSVNRADATFRTAEQRAHKALREARELLEAVTEGAGVMIATVDTELRYTFFNKAHHQELKRLTGEETTVGMSLAEVLAGIPDQQKAAVDLWRRSLNGETIVQTLEFGNPGRHRRVYSVRLSPVRDADGQIVGAGEVTSDVTELAQAQEALRRGQEQYQALFTGMSEGFALHEIICDDAGEPIDYRFLDVNPAFERLTGLRRQDLIGRTVLAVMPGTEQAWIEKYGHVALTGEPAHFEQYSSALGRHYEVYAYRPLKGQFAAVFMDVTERKQTEAALQRYEWLLNDDAAARPDLQQNVHHQAYGDLAELNTEGLLLKTLGRDLLAEMVNDYVVMLGSSSAIHEKNGDYALAVFASGWCRCLDEASRALCGTADNRAALAGGKWLCHESCWTSASRQAIESGHVVDVECAGGFRLFAVPILASGETVGAISFGYGEPPRDPAAIQAIAERYRVDPGKLRDLAAQCEPRPSFIVQSAKSRLLTSARLIGEMVERRRAEEARQRVHDELEQRVRERTAEVRTINQTLRMISECNQALVRAGGEEELVREICRIVHDLGGYRMAWVGYADNDPARTVRPVASVGFEEGYLEQARITWADEPRGRGPTGTCIRLRETRVCHNFLTDPSLAPWREQALARGYQSSIALPLAAGTQVFGALTIYSEKPEAFDRDQAALLAELADDLAFGIETLRARSERDHALALAKARAGQLQALATELVRAEQRERRRLAQVLHDHLQQLLVGARLNLASIGNALTTRQREAVGRVSAILDEATEAARTLTGELSPPALHEQGLVPGLSWLAREMLRKHGLRVDIEAGAEAEPEAVPVRVFLFEAVRELLFNAVKHAGVSRAEVRVERLSDGRVQVAVSDKGAGFDPEQTEATGSQITHFGLFSIRERLSYLGGRMSVDSAPGRGSRFTLQVPGGAAAPADAAPPALAVPSAEVAAAPAKAADAKAARGTGRKIRVLLADDHPVMRQGLALMLQTQSDIEVVGEAGDAEKAVSLTRRLRPDVVIMDVSMPRSSGLDATRRIATELPKVRVIGLSMHAEASVVAAMLKAGAVAYLTKGGPLNELIAAVRSSASAASPRATAAAAARRPRRAPAARSKKARAPRRR